MKQTHRTLGTDSYSCMYLGRSRLPVLLAQCSSATENNYNNFDSVLMVLVWMPAPNRIWDKAGCKAQ